MKQRLSLGAKLFEKVFVALWPGQGSTKRARARRRVYYAILNWWGSFGSRGGEDNLLKMSLPRLVPWQLHRWFYYLNNVSGLASYICKRYGHKLSDCSSAGPDSGNMDHECLRCGHYWSVPLY